MKYNVGDRIYFAEEKKPYKIRACGERFLICTKPYNFRPKTVVYTIVDLKEGIRGTDGYSISPYDYYKDEDCQEYLHELETSKDRLFDGAHVSYRNRIELNITKVVKGKEKGL